MARITTVIVTVVTSLFGVGLATTTSGQTVSGSASTQMETRPAQVGYGVGSVLGTLVYAPLKGTFCILGALTSVGALPFGTDTAGKIASASCRGTWVITPDVVRGKEPVNFIGKAAPR